jgi:hypothetical protein
MNKQKQNIVCVLDVVMYNGLHQRRVKHLRARNQDVHRAVCVRVFGVHVSNKFSLQKHNNKMQTRTQMEWRPNATTHPTDQTPVAENIYVSSSDDKSIVNGSALCCVRW